MASPSLSRLLKVLRRIRVAQVGLSEAQLHQQISQALLEAGIEHRREFPFAKGCRADFWVDPGWVIEVKKKRPVRALLENQIARYARSGKVKGLVVLLERAITLEPVCEGVPVHVVSMNAAWGVAI